MKEWYNRMFCEECQTPIGYYIDSGPGSGCGICDKCYEDDIEDSDFDDDDDEE